MKKTFRGMVPGRVNTLKTNNHPPDIATASDMQTNGVSMGDIQPKLFRKEEELTLYVIEQKKEIEALKKENNQLKSNSILTLKKMLNLIPKEKMKTYIYSFLCLIFMQYNLFAQIPQEPITALSPNAASLGLYGDIPVSLFTGTPEISIPLYDLKVKDFTLPISLNYHASGIQVDQHPGWVGLGWSLFAGGVITRSVNDLPDEFNSPNFGSVTRPMRNAGYYFNHDVLNNVNWNNITYMRTIAQNQDLSTFDTAPDEFSFNFAGYSGKFYLDHLGQWAVQCDKPVKVEFNGNFFDIPFDKRGTVAEYYNYTWSRCFSGFTITAENGIKYIFGENIDAIEFSTDFFTQYLDEWTATAFYLTKIVLPSGEEINFTYQRFGFSNQMYIAVSQDLGTWTESNGGWVPKEGCQTAFTSTDITRFYEGKLISPVYLSGISTDNTEVWFGVVESEELKYSNSVYDYKQQNFPYYYYYPPPLAGGVEPRGLPFLPFLNSDIDGYPDCLNNLLSHELEQIEIRNTITYNEVKDIHFYYNNNPNQRLVLDSVIEAGKNPYKFHYSNIADMPAYLANKSDHWGFYNNTFAYLNDGNYYSYRNPNAAYTKYGLLSSITYPTGGRTEFTFEPHYYRKQLNENRWETPLINFSSDQLAGGVRIKNIKHFNTSGQIPDMTKEYYYVSDYLQNKTNATQSSGVLGGQIKYSFDYRVRLFNDNDIKLKKSFFSSFSVLPSCNNAQGSHIGYSEVIEKMSDNSFNRYQYTNFDNGYMDSPADEIIQLVHTPYEPYSSKSIERGNLILKEMWDANGKRVSSYQTEYETTGNNYVRAMKATSYPVCNPSLGYDEGCAYKIYTYSVRPNKTTETYYDKNTEAELQKQERTYSYDSEHMQLTSTITQRSDGTNLVESYKYPYDFMAQSPPYNIYNDMVSNKHIWSSVIEKSDYKGSISPSNLLQSTKTNYGYYQSNTIIAPSSVELTKGTLNPETRLTFDDYDNKGNLLCVSKAKDISNSYIWGYNQTYPIAKVVNATSNEIYFTSYEDQPQVQCWVPYLFNNTHSKTGNYSLLSVNNSGGEYYYFSPFLDISNFLPKKYKYSVWAYSDGPSVELYFFMKPNRDNDFYSSGWQAFSVSTT
ncbi:MAG TPA: hypothetical protein VIH57_21200, partial [Bacteroidales bacterium]